VGCGYDDDPGNYGGTELDNIYMEEGSGPCTNPYLGSSFGATGIIYQAMYSL